MRPLRLKMTAFGPFSSTAEIRFDRLGTNPLFLINGPTGSGKTTILDAICFALYGKSTGNEREAAQMRCDLAKADSLTQIVLTFALGGKHYRITRIPEQQRPKSRGEGVTDEKAKAEFCELSETGEERIIVASKVKEATAEIEALTGLNVDQFRQVMVLPQGKFRQLLMASSKDRESIFSNLFQTRVYKKLEENLKRQAAAIKDQVDEQSKTIQLNLETVELKNPEALETEFEQLIAKHKHALQEKQERERILLEATKQLQSARSLADQFLQLDAVRKKLEALNKQKQIIDQKLQIRQQAELAQKLLPVQQDLVRCQEELAAAVQKLESLQQEERTAQNKLETANQELKQVDSLTQQTDQSKQRLIELRSFAERSAKLVDLQQKLTDWEKTVNQKAKHLSAARQRVETIVQQKEQSEKTYQQLQQSQSSLPKQQLALKELTDHLQTAKERAVKRKDLTKLQTKLSQTEKDGKQLAEKHEQNEAELKALELRWHRGQAAILAQELRDDMPCPVCGSTDHPLPARSQEPLPTESELELARKSRQRSQERLMEARERYARIKNEEKNLRNEEIRLTTRLGPHEKTTPAGLEAQHNELAAQVTSLLEQQNQLTDLEQQISKQKQEEQKSRRDVEAALVEHNEKKEGLTGIKTQVETVRLELPEAYRKPGDLEKAIVEQQAEIVQRERKITAIRKHHQDCLGLLTAATASRQAAKEFQLTCSTALKKSAGAWQSALEKSEFDSEATYLQSLLGDAELNAVKQEISDYESQVHATRGALAQQASQLEGKQKPDLPALEQTLQQLDLHKTDAEKTWQALDKRFSQLQAASNRLKKAIIRKEELEAHYALIGTLSSVANGQTGKKISLQRFVLSVLLDDVLVEASLRLKLMSKGRYRLLRKEDSSKWGKASGLELEVEDAYSGKVRPVETLSGGESFMAALAMALGLSDVVQAYAGGIKLDTLFIDEGFGSLDQESLDLAIRTLIDLQSTGRMIGIISHVSDLKEQLPIRLDIVSDRHGSKIVSRYPPLEQ